MMSEKGKKGKRKPIVNILKQVIQKQNLIYLNETLRI